MPITDIDLRSKVMLSVQRALVGCITPEIRFISVEWSQFRIHLHVYVDGPMAEGAYEGFDAKATTQIIADFPYPDRGEPQVSCTFHRCDAPAKPPLEGDVVYEDAKIELPKQLRQPTPGERVGSNPTPQARGGCTQTLRHGTDHEY